MFRVANLFTWMRRLGRTAATGAALAAAACGGDSTGPLSEAELVGEHDMVTINDFNVPHTFTDAAGSQLTIDGGSLQLEADGTFDMNYAGLLNALEFDLDDEGTYSVSGSTVTFQSESEGAYTGEIAGNTLIVPFRIAGVMFDLGFRVR